MENTALVVCRSFRELRINRTEDAEMSFIKLSLLVLITMNLGCQGIAFDFSDVNDTFDAVKYNDKVDILWVVDANASMDSDREILSQNIQRLFQQLESKDLDYNMATITMDMSARSRNEISGGRFVGNTKVINTSTPNKLAAFKSMFSDVRMDSDTERAFEAVIRALQPDRLGNENSGFLREDSLLVINFVSDERDSSTESVEDLANFLDIARPNLKTGNRGWVANFVGVIDDSCESRFGLPLKGIKYPQIADLSEGTNNSICQEDLSLAIQNINQRLVTIITDRKLDRKPDISTIVVKMNNVIVAQSTDNGWSYIEELNTIRFHGDAIPRSTTLVEIDFKPIEL
ncbi:MAG: hypothetical protein AB8E15_06870 [Bdellovibrionales bacterium]